MTTASGVNLKNVAKPESISSGISTSSALKIHQSDFLATPGRGQRPFVGKSPGSQTVILDLKGDGKVRCRCEIPGSLPDANGEKGRRIAKRLVSKTLSNPDRGFYTCAKGRDDPDSCGFFSWEDHVIVHPSYIASPRISPASYSTNASLSRLAQRASPNPHHLRTAAKSNSGEGYVLSPGLAVTAHREPEAGRQRQAAKVDRYKTQRVDLDERKLRVNQTMRRTPSPQRTSHDLLLKGNQKSPISALPIPIRPLRSQKSPSLGAVDEIDSNPFLETREESSRRSRSITQAKTGRGRIAEDDNITEDEGDAHTTPHEHGPAGPPHGMPVGPTSAKEEIDNFDDCLDKEGIDWTMVNLDSVEAEVSRTPQRTSNSLFLDPHRSLGSQLSERISPSPQARSSEENGPPDLLQSPSPEAPSLSTLPSLSDITQSVTPVKRKWEEAPEMQGRPDALTPSTASPPTTPPSALRRLNLSTSRTPMTPVHELLTPVSQHIARQERLLAASERSKEMLRGRVKALEQRIKELESMLTEARRTSA